MITIRDFYEIFDAQPRRRMKLQKIMVQKISPH